ncbi:magnesium transporter [Alteromonas oceanisediminis]|uniref:magnesium transporter n=1 Tax=Alteromonas oceanisediminis TaxID=2836180 RepID=UPI001BDB0C74|nr:magnesium transporter [Alteromonas oceanisediminis]MBT0585205.1 magnesium transporter [Alteromonas oceanisediminis]
MAEALESNHTRTQTSEINAAMASGRFVTVRRMLHTLPPSDVALILESSPKKTRNELWELLDNDAHSDVIEELSEEVRNGIITQMPATNVVDVLGQMDTDDLAETLSSLPEEILASLLTSMDAQDRFRAEQAMSYGEETAGFIMNTDTITLRSDVSIDVVLRYLRLRSKVPEDSDTFYVVNRNDKLIGSIPVIRLLTEPAHALVGDVMDDEPEAIPVDMNDGEVASLFERYNWLSAPVVDEKHRLVGRITIDDVVDIIREDAEHSMMSMAGLDDEEDTFAPVLQSTRRRSVWLGVNLATALLAAAVSDMFEATLSQLAVLAILNTIVPSMGGVAGNQTLTLVIRGMALGHVNEENSRWLISKELAIGFFNGIIWAVLIAAVIAIWKQDYMLGVIIAFAMMANMIAAALSGATLPLIMKRLKIDPALAGSVILTTITDVVGIFAFLGTATLFLV